MTLPLGKVGAKNATIKEPENGGWLTLNETEKFRNKIINAEN